MAFSFTWDASFEASPADTDDAKEGANRIRDERSAIRERAEVDHRWGPDVDSAADDGQHHKVTLPVRGSDPTNIASTGIVYTKDVSAKAELFYVDEDGNVIQLTDAGALKQVLYTDADWTITGEIRMWSTATPPTNWLECDGSAVNRTTYAALFAVIGTTFGIGDGSTTFNLPDYLGRGPIGVGTGDAADATAWTLAEKGGAETHVLTEAEMPAHTHGMNLVQNAGGGAADNLNNPGTSRQTGSTGGDTAHNNMPPVLGIHFIIKT